MAFGFNSGSVFSANRRLSAMDLIIKHRRSLLANRKSELVAFMAISTTLFLFFHTRDLHSKLKELEVKLQPDVSLSGQPLSAHSSNRIVGLERILKLEIPGREPIEGWKYLSNSQDVCTGVLMSPTEVLTTCGCLLDLNVEVLFNRREKRQKRNTESLSVIDPAVLRVRMKDIGLPKPDRYNVSEIQIHPKCDGHGSHDLAMLRLSNPVANSSDWFNTFPFGSDWNGRWDDIGGRDVAEDRQNKSRCYLASFLTNALIWGHSLRTKEMHNGITDIPVEFVDMEYCNRFLSLHKKVPGKDLSSKICVEADRQPLPICKADIGSPLICHDDDNVKSSRLIGMTSIGHIGCNPSAHDAVAIVTPLDNEAWNFIHDFMRIGYKRWAMYLLKRSLRHIIRLVV